MIRGQNVQGARLCRSYNGFIYHVADHDGRCYLCDCARSFRLGKTIVYPANRVTNKYKLEPINYDQRKTRAWRMNLS